MLGPVLAGFRKDPTPLSECSAAQSNLAAHHAHTALMSNVGQRFLDFYIATAEQWLTCMERVTSKSGGGGGLAELEFDTSGKFAAY